MTQEDQQKWDRKYSEASLYQEVSKVVQAYESYFPRQGRALDIAGGAGRHSVWLAQRGLDVTLVDVSREALNQARARAENSGVQITTVCHDLDLGLPTGQWDLIFSNLFFDRNLFSLFAKSLAPGGRLIVIQPTLTNASRHKKPPVRFLPGDDELPALVEGLEVILYENDWLQDGRFDGVLIAETRSAKT